MDPAGELSRDAQRFLRDRARSCAELRRHLLAKGHPPDRVAALIDEYFRIGALDDRALAESIARAELARSVAPPRAIEARLLRRGIDPDLARDVATRATADRDPLDDARAAAATILRTLRRKDPASDRRRLLAALARRGFDEDAAVAAVDRLIPPPGDP